MTWSIGLCVFLAMPVIVWARELAYFVDERLELLTARRRERRDERDLIDWLNSL